MDQGTWRNSANLPHHGRFSATPDEGTPIEVHDPIAGLDLCDGGACHDSSDGRG